MPLTVEEIGRLLRVKGAAQYGGEPVSQLDHALQCACLAEEADEPDELVVAALLHDLGHLLMAPARPCAVPATHDDLHQYLVLPFLRGLLPDTVLEPIRLHVDAKRCLCATEPGYRQRLSPESQRSLALQGQAFSFAQVQSFHLLHHADDALRLRRYDDQAKVPGRQTPPLSWYLDKVEAIVESGQRQLYQRLACVGGR